MKQNWKPIVFGALTFALGILCGGALTAGWMIERFEKILDSDTSQAVELGSSYVARRLNLDESQKAALQPIADEVAGELHALRTENAPRVRQILEQAVTKLAPNLHAEQKAKLEELMKKPRERWERLEKKE